MPTLVAPNFLFLCLVTIWERFLTLRTLRSVKHVTREYAQLGQIVVRQPYRGYL
jgi:hypothetical protein